MDDKEVFNPQSGERIAPKKPKKFWKDWRFYVYTIIAFMLAIVSVSSMVTACAAINAGVGQSESVSSEYKVKHNAAITTEGGFAGYRFSFELNYSGVENGYARAYTYDINTTTYAPSLYGARTGDVSTYAKAQAFINERYEASRSSTSGELRFLLIYGKMKFVASQTSYYNFLYSSFVLPNAGSGNMGLKNFVCTNLPNNLYLNRLDSDRFLGQTSANNYYLLTVNQNNAFVYSENEIGSLITFQDVNSYYQELGYQAGYSAGETAGNSAGYSSGYSDGHTSGYAEGYDAGETHAYETLQAGIAFETYGMYADAKITLVADRTEGSYYYMDLFDYVTDTNIERSVYVLYIQNASNSTWLGYVQDVNNSDSAGATYDIGSFTGASSTTDVVFTALMDRNLWEGAYITSFHGHAEAVNNAFWFTGGSYAATQQIYQDGYGEGYDAGRTDGYDVGYDAGVQVGRAQGLNEAEPESLTNTLVAVFQQPFNQLYRFFNFNVLGLNVLGIVSGLVSVLVVVKVFRKLYK